ncbi:MAG: hypothetical protein EBS53_15435 [Bacteroidetes bacterium]|nr:hypothetical protein [Bacteroidota bacterium]
MKHYLPSFVKTGALVAALGVGLVQPVPAATLNVIVAGYYGGNFLADTTTPLSDGTSVDFGVFYSAGSFTSQSTVASLLAANNTPSALQSFRANNGWVSFGSIALGSGDGSFDLQWDVTNPAGPGFGTEFNLDPSSGALAGKTLVGVKPYLWVQTAGSSPQFWVGVSNATLPSAGFGALYQGDVIDTGDPTTGFTMLVGNSIGGTGIVTIPEPSASLLTAVAFGVLLIRRSKFFNL